MSFCRFSTLSKDVLDSYSYEEVEPGDVIYFIKIDLHSISIDKVTVRMVYFDYTCSGIANIILYKCMDHIRKGKNLYKNFIRDTAIEVGKTFGYENVLNELPGLRLPNRFMSELSKGQHYEFYNNDNTTNLCKIPHILAITEITYKHKVLLHRLKRFLCKYGYFMGGRNNEEPF